MTRSFRSEVQKVGIVGEIETDALDAQNSLIADLEFAAADDVDSRVENCARIAVDNEAAAIDPGTEHLGAPPGDVMQEYFNTMDLFMDMQQQVMEAYLGLPGSADSKGITIGGIRQQAPAPPADVGSTRPPLSTTA